MDEITYFALQRLPDAGGQVEEDDHISSGLLDRQIAAQQLAFGHYAQYKASSKKPLHGPSQRPTVSALAASVAGPALSSSHIDCREPPQGLWPSRQGNLTKGL